MFMHTAPAVRAWCSQPTVFSTSQSVVSQKTASGGWGTRTSVRADWAICG